MPSKISILISCHADTDYVKNECLFPIQVGAALTDKRFEGMIYDNNGINISAKNKSYCELTAQYWAWKNLDSDYYGFCHYRRYFDFNTEHTSENDWGIVETQEISAESIEKYGWDEESIRRCVDGFDIITAPIIHIPETVYEQYAKASETSGGDLKIDNLDCVLEIIREKYPDYYPYAERFFSGHAWCWANMYILKKDIFFDYCQWLFDILDQFERRTDMSYYSVQCLRTPGHLSERLFNVYLMYILDHNPALRYKSIFRVDIKNTMKREELKPAFNVNNIAITISSSDYYSPITGVLLESIRANASQNNNYDILIMDGQISSPHKEMMASIFNNAQNFSLRFLDSHNLLHKYKLKPKTGYTVDAYARLLLPELMKDFDKVIYLDADTVVNADLAELFSVDLGDKLIGGVRDIRMAMWYGMPNSCQKAILDNQLNMKDPYDYFQCGVLLFNLKQFRKEFTVEHLFEIATSQYWDCLDQDVLNYLCREKALHLDMAWNVMIKWPVQPSESYAPAFIYNEYVQAHKKPKIIHYAGTYPTRLIPCFTSDIDMEEYFWKYARNTPFYEKLLSMRMEAAIERLKEEKFAVKVDYSAKQSLKQKIKRVLVMPIIDRLLPRGSNCRYKVKKAYFSIRGWKCE
ncbi:MAG: hypothetical protein ACFWUD_03825 [Thermocaproicibacter melissae]|jgi:lipopolysaccharide biosynthesis glycosyltransferase|uniref:DUF4422 domain-containing protein n=1 Tax=Thermocaproicibacter melissae TaxID=2966552 RepID=UPI003A10207A